MAAFELHSMRPYLAILLLFGSLACRPSESPSPSSANSPPDMKSAARPVTDASPTPLATLTPQERAVSRLQLTPIDRPLRRVDRLTQLSDATGDDWTSEVITDQLNETLTAFAQVVETAPEAIGGVDLVWVADDFTYAPLCPQRLVRVFNGNGLRVQRWDRRPESRDEAARSRGATAMRRILTELRDRVAADGERHVKLKLIRIDVDESIVNTDVLYEATGHAADVLRQQTAVWQCRWIKMQPNSRPQLQQIALRSFEQVEQSGTATLFRDDTASILNGNASYRQQMVPGIHHWLQRVTREFLGQFGHHGLAIGDVNEDGRDDVYVCDAGGLPNRLYVQQPDGSALDMSASAGVDLLDDSTSALLVDLDNDDDQDLIVIAESTVNIAENLGNTQFKWRSSAPGRCGAHVACVGGLR